MEMSIEELRKLNQESITSLKNIHVIIMNYRNKFNDWKDNCQFQTILALHRKIISLFESIILLADNFKYGESRMLIRNLFETSVLMMYFKIYEYEAERWNLWQGLSVTDKKSIPKDLEKFRIYLFNNGFIEISKILNKYNKFGLIYFKPTYLKEVVFEEYKAIVDHAHKKFLENFLDIINKFSHPTFFSLAHNDKFDKDMIIDVLKTNLMLFIEIGIFFVDFFSKFIPEKELSDFNDLSKNIVINIYD